MTKLYWALTLPLVASVGLTFTIGMLTRNTSLLNTAPLLMIALMITTLCLAPRVIAKPATTTPLQEDTQCSNTPPLPAPTIATTCDSNIDAPSLPASTEPAQRNY